MGQKLNLVSNFVLTFFVKKKHGFGGAFKHIYLAALGLNCGTQDPRYSLQVLHCGSGLL